MEQKRPADIIQELLDYLWNCLLYTSPEDENAPAVIRECKAEIRKRQRSRKKKAKFVPGDTPFEGFDGDPIPYGDHMQQLKGAETT